MEELYALISRQTEYFRKEDFQEGAAMMPEVSAAYEKVRKAIEEAV